MGFALAELVDEAGRMRNSQLCDRTVDVMEERMKFTLLTRDRTDYRVDRYSERKEPAEALMKQVEPGGGDVTPVYPQRPLSPCMGGQGTDAAVV